MTVETCHLTEEEVDELILGVAGPELQAHCAACAPCSSRVTAFSASLQPFRQASLAWSEARSNTFTRDLSGHKPTWRLTAPAARSVAATVILGLVAGVTGGTHVWPRQSASASAVALTQPAPRRFAPETRAQQIARDNAMMQAIDAELTEPESAPAALFRTAGSTAAQPASAQDRD